MKHLPLFLMLGMLVIPTAAQAANPCTEELYEEFPDMRSKCMMADEIKDGQKRLEALEGLLEDLNHKVDLGEVDAHRDIRDLERQIRLLRKEIRSSTSSAPAATPTPTTTPVSWVVEPLPGQDRCFAYPPNGKGITSGIHLDMIPRGVDKYVGKGPRGDAVRILVQKGGQYIPCEYQGSSWRDLDGDGNPEQIPMTYEDILADLDGDGRPDGRTYQALRGSLEELFVAVRPGGTITVIYLTAERSVRRSDGGGSELLWTPKARVLFEKGSSDMWAMAYAHAGWAR